MNKLKALVFAVIAIFVISSLALTVNAGSGQQNQNNIQNQSNRPVEKNFVRLTGIIDQWGATDVNGLLHVKTKTALLESTDTRQLAWASAIWTTNTSRPINSVKSKENFTFTFHAARLLNASVSTISTNSSEADFFMSGTWNVLTVTTNVTIITNSTGEILRVHRESDTEGFKAYGELTVTDNWSNFTLAIDGIDPLTGSVIRSVQRQMMFSPFKLVDASDNRVTRADFFEVAKCYRSMPGWGSYDTRMDFNNNFKIDIADLSTVAANI